jgi:hypothetical protein
VSMAPGRIECITNVVEYRFGEIELKFRVGSMACRAA